MPPLRCRLDDMELLVPLYIWPCPVFDDLIKSAANLPAGRKSAVIVGGSAGPGPEKPFSQLHQDHWRRLKDAGWFLYGYVHCTRGERPVKEVMADVDGWVELYGDLVGGIFVDESPNHFDEALIDYFDTLVSHIKGAGRKVCLNPGTEMHDGGVISSRVDIVVGFESSAEAWHALPLGFRCRCSPHGAAGAAMIHSLPSPRAGRMRRRLIGLLRAARARGFRVVYITDAVMPDPYNQLPSFWAKEVECLGVKSAAAPLPPPGVAEPA